MDKILITGGNGFIATNFITLMLKSGYNVVSIDNLTLSTYLNFKHSTIDSKNFKFIKFDILDNKIGDLIREYKFDYVINFAAESHVDKSIRSSNMFVDTNIRGTNNLISNCMNLLEEGVLPESFRFIQISTDEVYGSLKNNEPSFSELTNLNPTNPYSASKASADLMCLSYFKTHNFPVLITRCSNNYGPYQYPEKLIPLTINQLIAHKKVPVYGNGKQIRDWIFVEDHCNGIKKVLEHGCVGEIYNFGGNSELSNLDVIGTICQLINPGENLSAHIEHIQDRPGHDTRYSIDSSKSINELEWKPTHNFESAIKDTVSWYVANKKWSSRIIKSDHYTQWMENHY